MARTYTVQPADRKTLKAALKHVKVKAGAAVNTNRHLELTQGEAEAQQLSGYCEECLMVLDTEAKGDKLELAGGAGDMAYTLDKAASSVQVAIYDEAGRVVRVMDGARTAGLNRITWDGLNATGAAQPNGIYSYAVVAKDSKGEAVKAETRTVGTVVTVDQGADGVVLGVGRAKVKLGDILSIRAPSST